MPTIEVLPTSKTSITAPGWAYVPDTGYDPSKAPIQPSTRKRAARTSTLGGGISNDTRQANAVLKHLAELDKESNRDVQITIPGKSGREGRRDKKMTTNVRRILTSNKTFANHLADEEALLAQQTQGQEEEGPGGGSISRPRSRGTRRVSTVVDPLPVTPSSAKSAAHMPAPEVSISGMKTDLDDDPLLWTVKLEPPSAAEMEALVSAPPLSYNQARAGLAMGKPQRHFCEMCGYWGSIRCMKCGARVCGLECKTSHEEGRCLRY